MGIRHPWSSVKCQCSTFIFCKASTSMMRLTKLGTMKWRQQSKAILCSNSAASSIRTAGNVIPRGIAAHTTAASVASTWSKRERRPLHPWLRCARDPLPLRARIPPRPSRVQPKRTPNRRPLSFRSLPGQARTVQPRRHALQLPAFRQRQERLPSQRKPRPCGASSGTNIDAGRGTNPST